MSFAEDVIRVIRSSMEKIQRPDLFRKPICGFSAADDPRYKELKTVIGPWHCLPTELLPEAKTVISYYVPFTKEVAKAPKNGGNLALWAESYEVVNRAFDFVGEQVVHFLRERGYQATGFAATHTFDPKLLRSPWSHRSAAVISGLGTFGKNRMVITEKGSAGRFCTVFTSAEIPPTPMPEEEFCLFLKEGRCGLCVKACPANVLAEDQWQPFACYDHCLENAAVLTSERNDFKDGDVCGRCIGVCPRRYME